MWDKVAEALPLITNGASVVAADKPGRSQANCGDCAKGQGDDDNRKAFINPEVPENAKAEREWEPPDQDEPVPLLAEHRLTTSELLDCLAVRWRSHQLPVEHWLSSIGRRNTLGKDLRGCHPS